MTITSLMITIGVAISSASFAFVVGYRRGVTVGMLRATTIVLDKARRL